MNIDNLLDLMDETIEDAFTVPLTGKRMVDVDRMRELIDDMRLNMPAEIRQAKAIVQDRNDIVATARKESDAIIKRAEERARVMVGETEIVKQSQQKATEILTAAQQNAKEMRASVTNYCENVLRQTEEQLTQSVLEVKNLRTNVRQNAKEKRG